MAKCAYCNSRIILGGVQEGEFRFCNQKCRQAGALIVVARTVPDRVVNDRVMSVHRGNCPKCQQEGPVDIYTSHFVWSAVLLTSWSSSPKLSCRPCGKKAKALSAVGSAVVGWWGFPWGILVTPIQVTRNVVGLVTGEHKVSPSPALERIIRLQLADELRTAGTAMGVTPPPLPKPPAGTPSGGVVGQRAVDSSRN